MRWVHRWKHRWTSCWGRRAVATGGATPVALPQAVADQPHPPDDDVPPRGCAWFDSSHDLRQGLLVRELSLQVIGPPARPWSRKS